jgi:hypothetical protein
MLLMDGGRKSRGRRTCGPRVLTAMLIGFCGCLGFLWLLRDCIPRPDSVVATLSTTISKSHLEKYAAVTPPPPANSSVLDVFQVYQPVLTPSGPTDEVILGDGAENTTTIASASSGASCQVVLMEHVFALSYGQPFVGMWSLLSHLAQLTRGRKLHSAQLQVQQGHHELHRHLPREAV